RLRSRLLRVGRAEQPSDGRTRGIPQGGVQAVIASRRAVLALIAAAMAFAGRAFAQAIEVTESTVKAAFLYKFAGYVDWPDTALQTAGGAFVIGVMGNEEVYAELQRIQPGRNVAGR